MKKKKCPGVGTAERKVYIFRVNSVKMSTVVRAYSWKDTGAQELIRSAKSTAMT